MKDLVGKKVIDAAGNEVGEVEDVEVDFKEKNFNGIVMSGTGEIAQKILEKLGSREKPNITVSVEDISVIGTVIILSKKLS